MGCDLMRRWGEARRQVFALHRRGWTVRRIALRMGWTYNTARTYLVLRLGVRPHPDRRGRPRKAAA